MALSEFIHIYAILYYPPSAQKFSIVEFYCPHPRPRIPLQEELQSLSVVFTDGGELLCIDHRFGEDYFQFRPA
jgi:hypothetical protein